MMTSAVVYVLWEMVRDYVYIRNEKRIVSCRTIGLDFSRRNHTQAKPLKTIAMHEQKAIEWLKRQTRISDVRHVALTGKTA
jgi:hypothetical protein